jgi:hypothetical protein
MKKTKKFILSMALLLMFFSFAFPAVAQIYNVGGKEVTFDGFFRQEFLFNTNDNSRYNTNQTGLNGAYQMWLADANVQWNDCLEFRGIFRMWGDLAYYMLKNNNHFQHFYAGSERQLAWDTNWDQIVRELYFTYARDKFLLRVGRQQIGWGEADGLRVMDIINPLDARRMFQFYDTEGYEEVRIPKLMIKAEFYPGNFWKFYDNAVELYWNPGDIPSFGDLLPPHLDAQNRPYAEWQDKYNFPFPPGAGSFQWPTDMGNHWGAWAPPTPSAPVPVRLNTKEKAFTISNSEYGARIKLNIKDTFITLNYWRGWDASDHEIIKSHKDNLQLGPGGPTVRTVLHPEPGLWNSPHAGDLPNFPMVAWFDKVQPRIQVVGFTLSRELFGVGPLFCQVANPVLRMEGLYSINQTFNTEETVYTLGGVGPPGTLFKTVKRDQIRYMVGFDWSMQIPWNPKKATFVSGQFFHIYTRGNQFGDKNLLQLAPYDWFWPKNQYYMTLLMRTEYMNERVCPSMLYVQDFHTRSGWIKSKLDFKIGNHWRPQIGYLFIMANQNNSRWLPGGSPFQVRDNQESFGLFANQDTAWLRIQYQF